MQAYATSLSRVPRVAGLSFKTRLEPPADQRVCAAKALRMALREGWISAQDVLEARTAQGLWLDAPIFGRVSARAAAELDRGMVMGAAVFGEHDENWNPALVVYACEQGLAVESDGYLMGADWIPGPHSMEADRQRLRPLLAVAQALFPFMLTGEQGFAGYGFGYYAEMLDGESAEDLKKLLTIDENNQESFSVLEQCDFDMPVTDEILQGGLWNVQMAAELQLIGMGALEPYAWYGNVERMSERKARREAKRLRKQGRRDALDGCLLGGAELIGQLHTDQDMPFVHMDETWTLGDLMGVRVGCDSETLALDEWTRMSMETGEAFMEVFDYDAPPGAVNGSLLRLGASVGFCHAVARALNDGRATQ